MKKYRAPLQEAEQQELKRLSLIDLSDYSEADIREEFLVEVCKILGYRKEKDYSVSREESFHLNPLFLSVGSKRIKLDYLCSLRKQYFWIMDAKDGRCVNKSLPPVIDKSEVAQAHFYALHPEINCRYFVVSNGWYTNLYDRDLLDEVCTPLVSIPQREIANRFMELDQYIGATQILPMIKARLLDQIEKVFQSEYLIERHDEFVQHVIERAARAKDIVEKKNRLTLNGQTDNSH
ncbi:hypothetical protein [Chitinophaga agri]|uniref:Type I restriction enzyme R protein N-terminal domain-containing protein n=1 Tax=Chitinophaga agri TaxID=2703787 RepID=A0A6B9Z813_9BACT|nr:hypothetical protein [Chitinophaga agri]QHS58378.1 hypothetical protein GWR21_01850 [Chitinophaga agri]